MEPSATTVFAALLLASQLSGLSIDPRHPLPRVEVADQAEGRVLGEHSKFAAITSGDGTVVWLYRGWRGTPSDVCMLTHEMTHVLQVRHGWPGGCMMEPLAYRVGSICASLAGDARTAAYSAALSERPMCFE